MKSKNLLQVAAVVLLLFSGGIASAQKYNVQTAIIELERPVDDTEKDLAKCLDVLGKAAKHSQTMNDPKMYFYTGLTYLKIANVNSDLTAATPKANELALEAFNNCIKNDTKGRLTGNAKSNLLNVAIGLYNQASATYNAGDYARAFELFEKALPLLKYDVDKQLETNNLTADLIQQMMGLSAIGMNDSPKAIGVFETLIESGSTEPANYIELTRIFMQTGDTAKALETVQAGLEMNEGDKGLINSELDIYLKQGRSDELIEKLNVAIEKDPNSSIYYFARAISYEGMGKLDLAAADYDKTLEIDPTYYDAAYNKGVMYVNQASGIADQMNGKSADEINTMDAEIKELWKKAAAQFQIVFDNHDEMDQTEKIAMAKTMKKIYKRVKMLDKLAVVESYLEGAE